MFWRKILVTSIIFIASLLLACPPPNYKLTFGWDNQAVKTLTIREDRKEVTISGFHQVHGVMDVIWLKFKLIGFGTLNEKDCRSIFNIESNRFVATDYWPIQLHGNICEMAFVNRHNKDHEISFKEYMSDLDTTYVKLLIQNLFNKTDTIDVIFDKKWIAKRFDSKY